MNTFPIITPHARLRKPAPVYALSELQAEIIRELLKRFGLRRTWTPLDLYPQHDRRDYERRRELNRMTTAGLIQMSPATPRERAVIGRNGKRYVLALTLKAIGAYTIWKNTKNSGQ